MASGTKAPHFFIHVFRDKQKNYFQIGDNGLGIPKEIQQRVFEPFFTTKAPGEGTGLGLSVSYFIITESHHGTLTVDSSPNEGATFTIGLPLQFSDAGQSSWSI